MQNMASRKLGSVMTDRKKNQKTRFIQPLTVGVGASAGGLEFLKEFVAALPEDTPHSFIIVQHLDPTHESMLSDILSRVTKLPVKSADKGVPVEAGHVYVIPPNTYIELSGDRIKHSRPDEELGTRKAVDHLFKSLADELGPFCAGIILSGSGSDGTAGLRAIKAVGGLAMAQDVDEATHDSMPRTAIESGFVDKVVKVEEMYGILDDFSTHPLKFKDSSSEPHAPEQSLEDIAAILKTYEDFNLKQYKPATVLRRIARRMSLCGIDAYQSYLDKLRTDEDEREQLTQDLLINVTEFFRDPEAFNVLEERIIPSILETVGKGDDIRVWVPGCASGEEPYSIAILLLEALEKKKMSNEIKIFATDIDEHAIKIARKGVYPESIASVVPKKFLEKYFSKEGHKHFYRVKSRLRDLISFASQNVANDPPFGHMHLISCRNLLIYFKRDTQEKVLSSFYFSLKNNAFLFLGSSEALGNKGELFKTLSKKWRIYQKIPGGNERRVYLDHLHVGADDARKRRISHAKPATSERDLSPRSERMKRALLEKAMPPTLLADDEGRVLFSHGELERYVNFPQGEPRYDVSQVVKPSMRTRIRSALYKAKRSKEKIVFSCPIKEGEEERLLVRVEINPVNEPDFTDGDAYAIMFFDEKEFGLNDLSGDEEKKINIDLEQELAETREELQNTIEELETSTEELKASHEEALSTNEELQSSNEELEASGEELRSLNEELNTVNAQLKETITRLKRANDDVENFFASTDVPTVFLDPDLEIQRYTPAAEILLKMGPRDIGRHIASLGRSLVDQDLAQQCKEVLQNFQPQHKEVRDQDGKWFARKVTPYRTGDRKVEGVVVVFQNVTEFKELSQRALSRELQQSAVASLGIKALSGADPYQIMKQAVKYVVQRLGADYSAVFEYQQEHTRLVTRVGTGWSTSLEEKIRISDNQDTLAGFGLFAKEPVIVKNIEIEKRFQFSKLLLEHDVTSAMVCVINHSDPPYGILGVYSKEERVFTEEDSNFLVSVANMLSTAFRTRQSQNRLHESEERFRSLANSIPQMTWMTDETGYIHWYNQRWFDYTGSTYEEMKGWGWKKVHHPDHVDRVTEKFQQCVKLGEEWEDTFPIRDKNGNYRWFLSRAKPFKNEDGKVVRWFGTNTDITEKLEQEEKLRDSERSLRLAKNAASLGVFELDMRTGLVKCDSFFKDVWGLEQSKEGFDREVFYEGIHPEDRNRHREAVEKATRSEIDSYFMSTYRVINKISKRVFWVRAFGQVLFDGREPVRIVGMVDDITSQKNLEDSLSLAVEKLKEDDRRKNEFLSILGHELRNPLAVLSGGVDVLGAQDVSSELLPMMRKSINSMSRLLDELLDLNRVSNKQIELRARPINLTDALKNMIAANESPLTKGEQTLRTNFEENLLVLGDETRLDQVFVNLINNACKYSPEGSDIFVNAYKDDGLVKIEVIDEGIGIDSENLEKVFRPFYQIKNKGKAKQGLGIGLALAEELIRLHGGKIIAESEGEFKGSKFTVSLPALNSDAKVIREPNLKNKTSGIKKGISVLLIEDNPDILKSMPLQLELLGCVVDSASSGKEGIGRAKLTNPEVILVDIGLPDMSGHDIAKAMRSYGFKGIMVAISGYGHEKVRELSREAGFNYHLAKPASLDGLADILSQVEDDKE